jgi:hypothetical protein
MVVNSGAARRNRRAACTLAVIYPDPFRRALAEANMAVVKAKCCLRFNPIVDGKKWLAAAAILLLAGVDHPAASQSMQLTTGIATGAISCAPSNNGTGHLVCLEYGSGGNLVGVSWEAPPAVGGSEAPNAVDPLSPVLPTPAGTPQGAPGCGPANDGSGSIVCLIVAKTSSGFTFQGVAFNPFNTANVPSSALQTLGTAATSATIGNPGCAATDTKIAGAGGSFGAVFCALVMNGALFGVGFEPHTNTATPLTALSLGAGFTGTFAGAPSCAPTAANTPGVCAVRMGNTLIGFTLLFNPPNGGAGASLIAANAVSLGATTVTSDPSCAVPENGKNADNTFTAICGVISGNTLLGIAFDPQDKTVTAFETLGGVPDGGTWTGSPSCAFTNDGLTPRAQFENLVSCGLLSSTTNLFEVTFDPRGRQSFGINGPFGSKAEVRLNCIEIAIDADALYCGATVASGASDGFMLPVGILPLRSMPGILQSLQ